MGRVAMLTGSRGLRYATVIALVAALVGGVYVLSSTGNKRTIVGYFTSAVGLYPGDQVRVLGVPVGEIDMIEPRSSDVKITMSVSKDVKVPVDVQAVIMSPNLVAARFIQLTPVYTGGAVLPDNGRIDLDRAAGLLSTAQRPVIMAGTNVWWGHAEAALLRLVEERHIPVLMNGMARGVVPADHRLAFSRARSKALGEADVALIVGVPMDFRLGFGGVFGSTTQLIVADRVEPAREHPRPVAAGLYGDLTATLSALAGSGGTDHQGWIEELATAETMARDLEKAELVDDRIPLHPMRVYAELAALLERDALVVIDAGDFGSYAGRMIDSYLPGCWLDSGPFGCLGSGPGYALAAKLARPQRQVVLLQGDGAFGFSGMEWDTLVRHNVAVVSVIGNNGIWGLEKHPMEALYGYSVVAELRPGTRYDEVVRALGGHGELVSVPAELRPALERAFASGLPAVVNVLTDPSVAYPRRSNLA